MTTIYDKSTYHKLWSLSNEHAQLYNHLLDQVWKQINEDYKNFRNDNQLTIPSKSAQNTSRVLIDSIKSYYALKKKDPNAKFPKREEVNGKLKSLLPTSNSKMMKKILNKHKFSIYINSISMREN